MVGRVVVVEMGCDNARQLFDLFDAFVMYGAVRAWWTKACLTFAILLRV